MFALRVGKPAGHLYFFRNSVFVLESIFYLFIELFSGVPGPKHMPEHNKINNITLYISKNIIRELSKRVQVSIQVLGRWFCEFVPNYFLHLFCMLDEGRPALSQGIVHQLRHSLDISIKQLRGKSLFLLILFLFESLTFLRFNFINLSNTLFIRHKEILVFLFKLIINCFDIPVHDTDQHERLAFFSYFQ